MKMRRWTCFALWLAGCAASTKTPAARDAGSDTSLATADAQVDAGTDSGTDADTDSGVEQVFWIDFEGASLPSNVDPGTGLLTGTQGFAPLGPAGDTFGTQFLRSPTANIVTITISDLPAHTSISLDMLFAAIDSLDGTGSFPAGDYFRIDIDGVTVFRESFANATPDQIQSYMPPPEAILARHVDLGFQGPGGYYTDSAYDFGLDPAFRDFPHTGATVTLTFTLEGTGVQSLDDESWAIDNVRVIVGNTPRAVDAGVGAGG